MEIPSSRSELIELIEQSPETQWKYEFFWGHTPQVPGTIDKSCLSNWYPAPFDVDQCHYLTTEHYMMAEKARLFEDHSMLEEILATDSPRKAKACGRKVQNFDDTIWKANRFEIVVAGNLAKFSTHTKMGGLLLQTGEKVLVEASPRDTIWGIGYSQKNEKAQDPKLWRGQNLLGFALMKVRSVLAGNTL